MYFQLLRSLAHAMMVNGSSIRDILTELPGNLQALRYVERASLYFRPATRPVPFCTWLSGRPGTGKSRWCAENLPAQHTFWVPPPGSKQGHLWFPGYDRQPIVVFDDFRPEFASELLMLRICDRYPLTVEFKGGHIEFRPTQIFVTSNFTIEEIAASWGSEAEALARRFREPCGATAIFAAAYPQGIEELNQRQQIFRLSRPELFAREANGHERQELVHDQNDVPIRRHLPQVEIPMQHVLSADEGTTQKPSRDHSSADRNDPEIDRRSDNSSGDSTNDHSVNISSTNPRNAERLRRLRRARSGYVRLQRGRTIMQRSRRVGLPRRSTRTRSHSHRQRLTDVEENQTSTAILPDEPISSDESANDSDRAFLDDSASDSFWTDYPDAQDE